MTKFFDEKDIVKEFHLNEEKMPSFTKHQSYSRSESNSRQNKPTSPERLPQYPNGSLKNHSLQVVASKPSAQQPPYPAQPYAHRPTGSSKEPNSSKAEARASRRENRLHQNRQTQDENESSSTQNVGSNQAASNTVVAKGKGTTRSGRAIAGEPQNDTPPAPNRPSKPNRGGKSPSSKSPTPMSSLVAKIARGQIYPE